MKSILSDQESGELKKLIAETEKRTNTQVVLAIIQRSDTYAEIPWKAFALGASIASLLIFVFNLAFNDWHQSIDAFLVAAAILASGAVLSLFTVFIPGFARLFLVPNRANAEVKQYAESLFLAHELFATRNRNGILLLVSLFERKVVILPDKDLQQRITKEAMQDVISSMTPFLKQKNISESFKSGMEKLSRILIVAAAAQGRGENELPDDIIEEDGV